MKLKNNNSSKHWIHWETKKKVKLFWLLFKKKIQKLQLYANEKYFNLKPSETDFDYTFKLLVSEEKENYFNYFKIKQKKFILVQTKN